jgi:hypothetical protein
MLEAIRQSGILDIGIGGNFNLSKASVGCRRQQLA